MKPDADTDRVCSLWREQPTDAKTSDDEASMTETRMERLRKRVLLRNAVEYVAAIVVVATFARMMFDGTMPAVMRVAAALSIAGTLYVVVQLHRRTTVRRRAPGDVAQPCLAFHRRELERQRDALASVARWYLAPFVPGLLAFFIGVPIATGRGWALGLGSLAMAAILYFAIAKMNGAAARRLQREIDALDEEASG